MLLRTFVFQKNNFLNRLIILNQNRPLDDESPLNLIMNHIHVNFLSFSSSSFFFIFIHIQTKKLKTHIIFSIFISSSSKTHKFQNYLIFKLKIHLLKNNNTQHIIWSLHHHRYQKQLLHMEVLNKTLGLIRSWKKFLSNRDT